MIVHIVLFKWQEGTSSETLESVVKSLEALKDKIPEILEISCGQNFSERAKGFEHGLMVKFSDRTALTTYASHPAHLEVVNNLIRPILVDIIALDYEI
ncbi:Stress responsive alpha-beta barrel domain protein [Rippkaea orientalis PCC 8801]|uniref:Stress responsive alpha-beta barrel domain protein n=1 Tax=Rippkaea orientalis (strain PCC 8801 / RF-1) TaxID=41431 RepID=B7JUI3_RIPO1|nr:Dabb family protein [Rippkaea orientalis]ACK65527.1 Stress responsive alpha-beta barrel domain protein [Rippkaea orientalis PCC 8801]